MDFSDLAAFQIHDVKNRLAILASHAEVRGDHDGLRGLLECAASLSQLLAFYKAEKGSLGVDIDARVPAYLLAELSAEIARQSPLTVTVESDQSPALWFYDETLVRMVLLNALYNSLRYARHEVRLGVAEQGDELMFVVADDGPGYPAALLAQPLEMQPLSREGTGLGLHLAGRVAALHHHQGRCGRVTLSNGDELCGACFRLYLPR